MTNQEALQSKINFAIKPVSVQTALMDQEIDPSGEYNPSDKDNRKAVDLALAALILVVCTSPKSIKELDFQIAQHDVDQLLLLRSVILRKHGEPDELDNSPKIISISDLW